MQFSHSRLGVYENCPYKYKLQYIDKLKVLPPINADNALILGTSIHTGIEKDVETAIKEYYMSYPIIDDLHINEAMKLEYLIPKVKELLPLGKHEIQITTSHFIGYMDLLVSIEPGVYDLYDFKYSNNIKNYVDSGQLHEYKYFWEKQNPGKKIRNMYFVFVPKVQIKQKKTEDLRMFRQRIMTELEKSEVKIVKIDYDPDKVIDFAFGVKKALEEKDFEKNKNYLCNWCDYQALCEKGEDYMILPGKERRAVGKINKKVIWLYGSPFSGKTYLANKFPDPIMLNTDGNIKFVDAPFIAIKDNVSVEGRITKRTLAWQVYKDSIAELEKKQNEFKTIVVDLLEDTYEACRLYMYDQMGITHESDDSFRAWDKVRTEFLSTLKRLINLDYENIILISHEDTSKDITKKGGDKVTAIKPNLQEKTANKVAGMVDIVARVIADDNIRTLNFKTNEVIFGGGRLNVTANTIPLDYDELMKVYAEANSGKTEIKEEPPKKTSRTKKTEETLQVKVEVFKSENNKETVTDSEEKTEEPIQEEVPKTRTRRKKTEETELQEALNENMALNSIPGTLGEQPKDVPEVKAEIVEDESEVKDKSQAVDLEPTPSVVTEETPKTRTRRKREA